MRVSVLAHAFTDYSLRVLHCRTIPPRPVLKVAHRKTLLPSEIASTHQYHLVESTIDSRSARAGTEDDQRVVNRCLQAPGLAGEQLFVHDRRLQRFLARPPFVHLLVNAESAAELRQFFRRAFETAEHRLQIAAFCP